jgi:hypothetical protein
VTPISLLVALAMPANATIVNVFTPSVGPIEDGWHGSVTAATTLLAGNEKRAGAKTAAGVRIKHAGAHLTSLTGSGEVAYALDELITDRAFANLRHRWMFAEPVAAFGFLQVDHNALRALQIRDLAGVGLDVRLVRKDWAEAHVGVAMMVEQQRLSKGVRDEDRGTHLRNSNYLTLAVSSDKVSLASTSFFQPRVDAPTNWRALEELVLTVKLAERLDWTAKARLEHDSDPPEEVAPNDLSTLSGLVVTF